MNRTAYLFLIPLVATSSAPSAKPDKPPVESAVPIRTSDALSLRPVKWSVVGGTDARTVVSGRTVPVTVQADIAKGWHIYSLSQKSGGPIPLRLQLMGSEEFLVRGVIKAPKPERTFDKNFGIETELYSGSPRFTIPVGVPGRTASGVRKLQIGARYQVCSDKVCLPPRTDTLSATIRVSTRA